MSQRFFSDESILWQPPGPGVARLTGAEAHHLLHVMRAKPGDRVTLFDGTGAEFAAVVAESSRSEVTLSVLARDEVDRESPTDLTLGVALPKGDRQKVLVEKLTELGCRRLVPLVTERGVAAPKASGIEKLRRAVVEASKQCGRNRLMTIDSPVDLVEFLRTTTAEARLVAHPTAEAFSWPRLASVAVAIGPEGGFNDAEIEAAQAAGWQAVSLGPTILRIETAAILAAASGATAAPVG